MTGRYKAYPEYKDAGSEWVGKIPAQWKTTKLKYIFDIQKRIAGEVGYDVLSITQRGIKVKDIESGDGQLSMDYSKYQLVYKGDFAMNHMDLLTGYVDISSFDGVTSPDYRVFRLVNSIRFYDRYYLYLLQFCYKQRVFFPLGQGSAHLGRWRLPTEAFNEVEYPTPSFSEQQQIANFLDHETTKIDTLITKQEKLIELLKEKRQAVISHAVTKGLNPDAPMKDSGVEWLGEVPEHWEVTKTAWHFKAEKGKNGQLLTKEYIGQNEGDFPVYSGQTGNNGVMGYINSYEFDSGEGGVLFSTTVGAKAMTLNHLKGKFSLSQNCLIIQNTSPMFNTRFCFYHFQPLFSFERGLIPEHMQASFRMEDLYQYKVALPSIEEQLTIANFLDHTTTKIDVLIDKQEQAIRLMKERKIALISAAVTGKIDVRDWQGEA